MNCKILRTLLPTLFAIAAAVSTAGESSVAIDNGWARASPPGAANGAAFLTLVNRGAKDNALVGAESGAASTVELHSHVMADGVARMRQVSEIPVRAGGRVELRPGGLHIMLIGLKAPLADGGELALTLKFADGSQRHVALPIRRGEADGQMRHGGH